MATASAPLIATTELPMPKVQDFTRTYRGGTLMMANGLIFHDLVDEDPQHTIRVRWEYLDATELATVKAAYALIKDTTQFYTPVEGDALLYAVTRPENGSMSITTVVTAGGELAYHVEFEMIESDDAL